MAKAKERGGKRSGPCGTEPLLAFAARARAGVTGALWRDQQAAVVSEYLGYCHEEFVATWPLEEDHKRALREQLGCGGLPPPAVAPADAARVMCAKGPAADAAAPLGLVN